MKIHTLSAAMVMCLMMVPIGAFAVDINYPDFSDLTFQYGIKTHRLFYVNVGHRGINNDFI